MKTIALIDADEVAFKAISSASKPSTDWCEPASEKAEPELLSCLRVAEEIISAWSKTVGADQSILCFSHPDRSNFRKEIDPTYKAKRTEKPAVYAELCRELCCIYCNDTPYYWSNSSIYESRLEGDDIMGLLAGDINVDARAVICSSDKDMKTIPGRLYDPYHNAKHRISRLEADRYWMTQTLTGDTSDGYPGLPKCGPVAAKKILAPHVHLETMWVAVSKAYRDKGFTDEDALKQARLARILRTGDYNWKTQTVNLWTPAW